ncbi:hypothetical protein [Marivita hallyeonensis]|uniref:Uncharacterized protein n=1 Tax=Marivita hallyeonensis TaxID=996342 RepID=A0A1M5XZZ6_9RHOB|nr:hypothetical protein [Marivita hallyeonensis]SHI04843.1 hypothetical protein SAMN05443551_4216 [Marivita hallyeonensis]
MSPILKLLAFYYLCDQAAATQVLSSGDVATCMANYNQIKLEFIDEVPAPLGTPARAAQNRLGYAGFKAWEAANPDLVEELRAKAQLDLALLPKTGTIPIADLTGPLTHN